ncbi:MAG: hypothetical protein IH987_21050 [Planctomycetes bacterium]|nr:hypothetical protein [Planctomycetota bacterium]
MPLRIGVNEAITAARAWLEGEEKMFSILMPCRYGKSDVIRMIGFHALERNACSVLVLTPSDLLANQIKDDKDWLVTLDRAFTHEDNPGLPDNFLTRITNFTARFDINGEQFLSSTIHLATSGSGADGHNPKIDEWLKAKADKFPRKFVLIVFDEAQFISSADQKAWGPFHAELLKRENVRILMLTGTPIREDGFLIPGFHETVIEEKEIERLVPSASPEGPEWIRLHQFIGVKKRLETHADYEYTATRAWTELPVRAIAKPDVDYVEIVVKEGQKEFLLSELPMREQRRQLAKRVRQNDVIDKFLKIGLDDLHALRERLKDLGFPNERPGAIVYGGMDVNGDGSDEERSNQHLKQIRTRIRKIDPLLEVGIATSKLTSDVSSAIFDRFKKGDVDVLVLKQMGAAGMDWPRAKVIIDLSPIRATSACIQRWMRGGTVWNNFATFRLVLPADDMARAVMSLFRLDAPEFDASFLEEVDHFDVPKRDPKDERDFEYERCYRSEFGDAIHDGRFDVGELELIEQVMDRYQVHGRMTRAELLRFLKGGSGESARKKGKPTKPDADATVQQLRDTCNMAADGLVKSELKSRKHETPAVDWGTVAKRIWNEAKKKAGVPLVELKYIRSIDSLNDLLGALYEMGLHDKSTLGS